MFMPRISTKPPNGIGAIWNIVPVFLRLALEDAGAEADAEPLDPHPAPARDEVVTALVDDDQEAERSERQRVVRRGRHLLEL